MGEPDDEGVERVARILCVEICTPAVSRHPQQRWHAMAHHLVEYRRDLLRSACSSLSDLGSQIAHPHPRVHVLDLEDPPTSHRGKYLAKKAGVAVLPRMIRTSV